MSAEKKNNTQQLFIINENWVFLAGMAQEGSHIFIVIPQAKQIPKYKEIKKNTKQISEAITNIYI